MASSVSYARVAARLAYVRSSRRRKMKRVAAAAGAGIAPVHPARKVATHTRACVRGVRRACASRTARGGDTSMLTIVDACHPSASAYVIRQRDLTAYRADVARKFASLLGDNANATAVILSNCVSAIVPVSLIAGPCRFPIWVVDKMHVTSDEEES